MAGASPGAPHSGRTDMRSALTWHLFAVLLAAAWPLFGAAAPLGLPEVPLPADNPQNPAKIALGDKLFHDPRLSSSGHVSCASCHEDQRVFTDSPLTVSKGVGGALGQRNAPSVANAAYFKMQFWDGRANSLEDQALQPLTNPVEMGLPDVDAAVAIVRADADYRERFQQAFGTPTALTAKGLGQAIASYERTLVFGDSPFDRYQYRGEKDALSPAAVRGLAVFTTWGRCVACHRIEPGYATFTDDRFHNIGIGINRYPDEVLSLATGMPPPRLPERLRSSAPDPARLKSELGRFAVTGKLEDLGAFKTPSLRNVALTAPYMHDGSLKTLREVVVHYVAGGFSPGDRVRNAHLDPEINFLEISSGQADDLVAFLEALTSPRFAGLPVHTGEPAAGQPR